MKLSICHTMVSHFNTDFVPTKFINQDQEEESLQSVYIVADCVAAYTSNSSYFTHSKGQSSYKLTTGVLMLGF